MLLGHGKTNHIHVDELGLVFSSIPKNASTWFKATLIRSLDRSASPTSAEIHQTFNSPLRYLDSDEQAKKIAQRMCVRSVVLLRDPAVRVLSAYLDKLAPLEEKSRSVSKSKPAWERILNDVNSNFRMRHLPPGARDKNFFKFLLWTREEQRRSNPLNPHWAPQSQFLFQPSNRYTDAIFFETDRGLLRGLLVSLGLRGADLQGDLLSHHTSAQERLPQYVGPEEEMLIHQIYKVDYREWPNSAY
jgi:hypothetical protein